MKENFCGNWIEISEPLAWILSYRALDVWQENSRLAMVDLFLEATCMLQQYYYCFQLSQLCNTLVNKYNVPYDSSLTQAGGGVTPLPQPNHNVTYRSTQRYRVPGSVPGKFSFVSWLIIFTFSPTGNLECTKLLTEAKCSLTQMDSYYGTCLHAAIMANQSDCSQHLLEIGNLKKKRIMFQECDDSEEEDVHSCLDISYCTSHTSLLGPVELTLLQQNSIFNALFNCQSETCVLPDQIKSNPLRLPQEQQVCLEAFQTSIVC